MHRQARGEIAVCDALRSAGHELHVAGHVIGDGNDADHRHKDQRDSIAEVFRRRFAELFEILSERSGHADLQRALRIAAEDHDPVANVVQRLASGDALGDAHLVEEMTFVVVARVNVSVAIDGKGDLVAIAFVARAVEHAADDSVGSDVGFEPAH